MVRDIDRQRGPRHRGVSLKFAHLNMRHSSVCLHLLVEYIRRQPCDILLLQDTCDDLRSLHGQIPGYSLFLPSRRGGGFGETLPLVAVLVRSSLRARPIDFSNQRMCGVFLDTPQGPIACISAYIHHHRGLGLEALSAMVTAV